MSCQTVPRQIQIKSAELAKRVATKLSNAESVALTFDIWSARRGSRGFGRVTAHYVGIFGRFENLILYFERIEFPHDSEAIRKFITDAIHVNNLEGGIVSITTDNASNNVSGIKTMSDGVWLKSTHVGPIHYKCTAHIIDLAMKDAYVELKEAIKPVRECVLAIRSSQKRKGGVAGLGLRD